MTDRTETETLQPEAQAPTWSGRKTLIFIIFLAPAVIIPLLLSGRVYEKEISLVSLEMREATWLTTGGFSFSEPDWAPVEEWPDPQLHGQLLDILPPLPEEGPSAWYAAMTGEPDPGTTYRDYHRTLPWAFFIQIPNTRALAEPLMEVVEVRLLAAAVLDPGNPADRACFAALNERLTEGIVLPAGEEPPRRRRRDAPPAPGERAAHEILLEALAALESGAPVETVRAALCGAAGMETAALAH